MKRYVFGGILCLGAVTAHLVGQEYWNLSFLDRLRTLCDAFTIPGMLLLLCGVLLWAAGEGALDGGRYLFSATFRFFLPGVRKNTAAYSSLQKKKAHGYGFLFVLGGIFFGIGLIFLGVYSACCP